MVPSADNDPDFTDEFCGFIQRCVANVDAAEFLLTLAKYSDKSWSTDELRAQLAPDTSMSEVDAQRRGGAHGCPPAAHCLPSGL